MVRADPPDPAHPSDAGTPPSSSTRQWTPRGEAPSGTVRHRLTRSTTKGDVEHSNQGVGVSDTSASVGRQGAVFDYARLRDGEGEAERGERVLPLWRPDGAAAADVPHRDVEGEAEQGGEFLPPRRLGDGGGRGLRRHRWVPHGRTLPPSPAPSGKLPLSAAPFAEALRGPEGQQEQGAIPYQASAAYLLKNVENSVPRPALQVPGIEPEIPAHGVPSQLTTLLCRGLARAQQQPPILPQEVLLPVFAGPKYRPVYPWARNNARGQDLGAATQQSVLQPHNRSSEDVLPWQRQSMYEPVSIGSAGRGGRVQEWQAPASQPHRQRVATGVERGSDRNVSSAHLTSRFSGGEPGYPPHDAPHIRSAPRRARGSPLRVRRGAAANLSSPTIRPTESPWADPEGRRGKGSPRRGSRSDLSGGSSRSQALEGAVGRFLPRPVAGGSLDISKKPGPGTSGRGRRDSNHGSGVQELPTGEHAHVRSPAMHSLAGVSAGQVASFSPTSTRDSADFEHNHPRRRGPLGGEEPLDFNVLRTMLLKDMEAGGDLTFEKDLRVPPTERFAPPQPEGKSAADAQKGKDGVGETDPPRVLISDRRVVARGEPQQGTGETLRGDPGPSAGSGEQTGGEGLAGTPEGVRGEPRGLDPLRESARPPSIFDEEDQRKWNSKDIQALLRFLLANPDADISHSMVRNIGGFCAE